MAKNSSTISKYQILIEEPYINGLRIAVLKKYFCDNMPPESADLFSRFVEFLRSIKVLVIDDLNLQNTEKYYSSWNNIRLPEATNVHLRWLNTRADDYSPEVKEMSVKGKGISAVDYIHR